jgi:hypothetical protein
MRYVAYRVEKVVRIDRYLVLNVSSYTSLRWSMILTERPQWCMLVGSITLWTLPVALTSFVFVVLHGCGFRVNA